MVFQEARSPNYWYAFGWQHVCTPQTTILALALSLGYSSRGVHALTKLVLIPSEDCPLSRNRFAHSVNSCPKMVRWLLNGDKHSPPDSSSGSVGSTLSFEWMLSITSTHCRRDTLSRMADKSSGSRVSNNQLTVQLPEHFNRRTDNS